MNSKRKIEYRQSEILSRYLESDCKKLENDLADKKAKLKATQDELDDFETSLKFGNCTLVFIDETMDDFEHHTAWFIIQNSFLARLLDVAQGYRYAYFIDGDEVVDTDVADVFEYATYINDKNVINVLYEKMGKSFGYDIVGHIKDREGRFLGDYNKN